MIFLKHTGHIIHSFFHLLLHPEGWVYVLYGVIAAIVLFALSALRDSVPAKPSQDQHRNGPEYSLDVTDPREIKKMNKAYRVLIVLVIPSLLFLLYVLYKRLTESL